MTVLLNALTILSNSKDYLIFRQDVQPHSPIHKVNHLQNHVLFSMFNRFTRKCLTKGQIALCTFISWFARLKGTNFHDQLPSQGHMTHLDMRLAWKIESRLAHE